MRKAKMRKTAVRPEYILEVIYGKPRLTRNAFDRNLRFARDAFLFRVHRRLIRGFAVIYPPLSLSLR